MESLFTSQDSYTLEGHELDIAVALAIKDIFKNFVDRGFSIRDIEYIMQHSVTDMALNFLLNLQTK